MQIFAHFIMMLFVHHFDSLDNFRIKKNDSTLYYHCLYWQLLNLNPGTQEYLNLEIQENVNLTTSSSNTPIKRTIEDDDSSEDSFKWDSDDDNFNGLFEYKCNVRDLKVERFFKFS